MMLTMLMKKDRFSPYILYMLIKTPFLVNIINIINTALVIA